MTASHGASRRAYWQPCSVCWDILPDWQGEVEMRWFHITVIAVLAIAFLIFALQNLQSVTVAFLGFGITRSARRSSSSSSTCSAWRRAAAPGRWSAGHGRGRGRRPLRRNGKAIGMTPYPLKGRDDAVRPGKNVASPTGASLNLYTRLADAPCPRRRADQPRPCRACGALCSLRRFSRRTRLPHLRARPSRPRLHHRARRAAGRFGTPERTGKGHRRRRRDPRPHPKPSIPACR